MDQDNRGGQWLLVRQRIKTEWIELTDEDLDLIEEQPETLAERVQHRHGISPEEARTQVNLWHDRNPTGFFERY